jgi:hypothetical protein
MPRGHSTYCSINMAMIPQRWLFRLASALGGVVLVLWLLDPTRPLTLILVLPAVAVGLLWLARPV